MPIRVLELRSVAGTGGGPDKTLIHSAVRNNPRVELTLCYVCNKRDDVFAIGDHARRLGLDYVEVRERSSFDPKTWRNLRELVRDRKFHIVHGHDYKVNLIAYWLSRVEGVIPLVTSHGWTGHTLRERFVYYPLDRFLLRRFPRVVAVSGEIKQTLMRAGVRPERVDVVLNGIDPEAFRRDATRVPAARRRYGVAEASLAIGAVGRLESQKRFDLLIDAFAALSRDSRGAMELLIAGEGSVRGDLEAQIGRLGLTGRCRLVGQASVAEFHHALDLFVQSSDYEGTPNVVLEAMAMETPIVATAVGGTAELVSDGVHALVIAPGDADRLARAMRATIQDPAAARARVRAARQRVETDLSFERRMQRLDDICEQLAACSATT
jgi:glycosyltransferase involved in cell wall biosynthesis